MIDSTYTYLEPAHCDDVLILTLTATELRGSQLSSELLQEMLAAYAEHQMPSKVILDLGNVEYLASLGLATILRFRRHLQSRDSQLLLCNLSDFLIEILQSAHLIGPRAALTLASDQATALRLFHEML